MAVATLKVRRGVTVLWSQRVACHPGRIHPLVQKTGRRKAVEHAVHRDAVDRHSGRCKGGFSLGLR